jgi:hypothetical protein
MTADEEHRLECVERVLGGALALKEASLVVFRRGVLVEFKTEMLVPSLGRTAEGRYRSWQLGPSEGHHCHLDLTSIVGVWFDAEPVSCQGGRLNYSVWFLTAGDCGNPYRPEGLFAVTLNAPYTAGGFARTDVILPVYQLHALHDGRPAVSASDAFIAARRSVMAAALA